MRERAQRIGAVVQVQSHRGQGTRALSCPATPGHSHQPMPPPARPRPRLWLPRHRPHSPAPSGAIDVTQPAAAAPVTLLVVDDHTLFRRGLIALLGGMPYLHVVGEAGDAAEA